MNIPEGWPTAEMIAAGSDPALIPKLTPMQPFTKELHDEILAKQFKAMLSVAPTPPEVEAVYQHYADWHGAGTWVDIGDLRFEALKANGVKTRILYTSPPSPKAEYSATGEPLNLRAAARKVIDRFYNGKCDGEMEESVINLRKFLDK